MKIRPTILLLGAAVVVVIGLLIWFVKRPAEIVMPTLGETNVRPPAMEQGTANSSQREAGPFRGTNVPTVQAVISGNVPLPPTQNKAQQMQGILGAYNDVPIVFYGKLEDQFGNAVAGAAVNFSVRIYNGTESTVERGQVTADGNGFFNITGYKGQSLGVVPQKTGYVLATTGTMFKYSHLEEGYHVPDPNNPVVLKMWKLQGTEPLLGIDQHYKMRFTDAPIYFDLVAGKIVASGGDLKITVNRPDGAISERNPKDWGFNIEAVDGGLMESSGQYGVTYWAPESGYQLSDTLTASSNRHGIGVIQQGLFIKSRNGQVYSKLSLTFGINSVPDGFMSVAFRGVANTNGSRNWEATALQ